MRIAIIFALLFHAAPAAAQQQDDTLRIVAAIRESGCSAHAEDLDRIQSSLGISREVIETIIMGMQNAGEIQIEGDGLRLSPAVCNESATAILPDFALARQINQSEAAMTNHVLALFAANGCELHSDQYQAYIDRKFPKSAAIIGSEVGEARFVMEAMPYLMMQQGLLLRTGDGGLLRSTGKGCN